MKEGRQGEVEEEGREKFVGGTRGRGECQDQHGVEGSTTIRRAGVRLRRLDHTGDPER